MALRHRIMDGLAEKLLTKRSLNAPGPWLDRLLELDRVSSDELAARSWEGFLGIFKYAYDSVPCYKEAYDQAGVSLEDLKSCDDLLSIPPVGKQQISANFPDRITSERSDRDSWTYIATSGTTDRQIIARHIQRTGADIRLEGSIVPEGSLSNPSLKKELEEAFHAPVHEVYGAHELGSVASTCEVGGRLHINMDAYLVETVRDGKHVGPGELGEVVVTSFINSAMPLIRYRPGDIGRILDGGCECGRNGKTILLEGRIQDTIVTSNGVFTTRMICEHFARHGDVEFFQLVQRDDTRFDLLVVETEKGGVDQRQLAASTSKYLGPEVRVRVRIVSTIKPEVSGKFRFVKSTSFEKFSRDLTRQNDTNLFEAIATVDVEEDSIVDAFFD